MNHGPLVILFRLSKSYPNRPKFIITQVHIRVHFRTENASFYQNYESLRFTTFHKQLFWKQFFENLDMVIIEKVQKLNFVNSSVRESFNGLDRRLSVIVYEKI